MAQALMGEAGWSRRFDDPIPLPDGRELATLLEAGRYIQTLPTATQGRAEWQAATEALLLVAQHGGPAMFARIGMMRAINAGKPPTLPPTLPPRRKRAKAYRLIG
ncbi:hypothetical protein ACKWRH_21705 [Bradyrhizobium sp. Pa8]|uniref:hypothetical protein n=1 Tax=Bradyrhizobium sp. Pa8 TaxID=3386552 RepID=UPI00403F4125